VESHSWMRPLLIIIRLALVPAGMAVMAGYFQYHATTEEKKTEATYQTVAPSIEETQEQVKALTDKVDLLQQLVIAVARDGGIRPTPAASRASAPIVAEKVDLVGLVKQLEQVQARPYEVKTLPKSANDALEQMAR